LRWAKSISTFFRLAWAFRLKLDFNAIRAKSRASSCSSRVMVRACVLGQQWDFDRHMSHTYLLARYLRRPVLACLLRGSGWFCRVRFRCLPSGQI
jgi:hypothetical protein